jgi:hypothetical protein
MPGVPEDRGHGPQGNSRQRFILFSFWTLLDFFDGFRFLDMTNGHPA